MATDLVRDALDQIAEKAGIDPSRLSLSPVMQDPANLAFYRVLYLDGSRVNVQWSGDYTLDVKTLKARPMTPDEIVESLAEQLKNLL